MQTLGLLLVAGRLAAGPWEPLFNGRNLTGWKQLKGTAPFTVEDGAIVGTTLTGSANSYLATERTYGDFIFECEVKQEVAPTNSGIMFRALCAPELLNGRVHGYQLDIDPSPRAWTGAFYDESRLGLIYPGETNHAAAAAYRFGEWNRLRIEAIGTSLRTWVNGQPVAHVVDAQTAAGFFALQVHTVTGAEGTGRRILWRNLRVQTADLQPSPGDAIFIRNLVPNTLSGPERAQGWRLLWDGATPKGWHDAKGQPFPATGWSIANGELTGQGDRPGSIVTDEAFAAFELQLDFKVGAGGNSGLQYFVMPDQSGEPSGLELQLVDDDKHPDAKAGVDGNRATGSLYDLVPRKRMPGGAVVPRAGQWHHARLVVTRAGHVEHWINGIKVLEYERGSADFAARVARSQYAAIPGFGLAPNGPILLQNQAGMVQFRSIKVRPL